METEIETFGDPAEMYRDIHLQLDAFEDKHFGASPTTIIINPGSLPGLLKYAVGYYMGIDFEKKDLTNLTMWNCKVYRSLDIEPGKVLVL